MADVFISYSRKDKDFVKVLHQALLESQYDAWIDWENIPLTADWWEEIKAGIEAADTFIFVISPDSISSTVCGEEVDYAVANNKRLMPIVRRDGFDMAQVRPALGKHNWLFFRECDGFNQAFQALVKALDMDLDYVKQHTRILVRAIEWDHKNRNSDLLLRGSELESVIQWLTQNAEKEPRSIQIQRDYINASITRRDRQRRYTIFGLSSFSVITLGLAALAGWQYHQAEIQRQQAVTEQVKSLTTASNALFSNQQDFDALVTSLKAGTQLKFAPWANSDPQIQAETATAIQRVLYRIQEHNRLEKHEDAVYKVTFSPDGRTLASASADKTIKLWNIDGTLLNTFTGHTGWVLNVAFNPDGKTIASAGDDRTIKLWKLDGTLLKNFSGHSKSVTAISFSPDGKILASASADKTVRIWRLDGTLLKTLVGHNAPVWDVSFSPDGKIIASASADVCFQERTIYGYSRVQPSSGLAPVSVFDYFCPRESYSRCQVLGKKPVTKGAA